MELVEKESFFSADENPFRGLETGDPFFPAFSMDIFNSGMGSPSTGTYAEGAAPLLKASVPAWTMSLTICAGLGLPGLARVVDTRAEDEAGVETSSSLPRGPFEKSVPAGSAVLELCNGAVAEGSSRESEGEDNGPSLVESGSIELSCTDEELGLLPPCNKEVAHGGMLGVFSWFIVEI